MVVLRHLSMVALELSASYTQLGNQIHQWTSAEDFQYSAESKGLEKSSKSEEVTDDRRRKARGFDEGKCTRFYGDWFSGG